MGVGEREQGHRQHDRQRRLFVAVPIADEARRGIGELVERVRAGVEGQRGRGGPSVRWVQLDNLHLTIRFLGATAPELVADAADAVHDAARRQQAFDVTIAGAGAFPSADRPRTLWLGIAGGAVGLGGLAATLDQALEARGWPSEERPFRAHLTLARADGVHAGPRTARLLESTADGRRWTFRADRLVLFESHLGGGPARYEPLLSAPIGFAVAAGPSRPSLRA